MRIVKLLAAAFLLASPTSVPAERFDDSGVVKVDCMTGSGSAVYIGGGRYVSVAHVLSLPFCAVDGVPVKDVKLSADKDFATFIGPEVGKALPVSCSGFKKGKNYLAIGFAFGWDNRTYLPLQATEYDDGEYRFMIGEVIPGMSGGAIVDREGKVVAVINKRWPARGLELKETEVCKASTKP